MPSSIISLLAAEVEAEAEVEADLDQDQAAAKARDLAKVARAKAVIHPAAQAPAKVVRHQEAIPLAAIPQAAVTHLVAVTRQAEAIRQAVVTRQAVVIRPEAAEMVATTSSTIEQFRS